MSEKVQVHMIVILIKLLGRHEVRNKGIQLRTFIFAHLCIRVSAWLHLAR